MDETSIRLDGDFSSPLGANMHSALIKALALDSQLPDWILELPGMSGRLYRRLINTLVGSVADARYLEIGSWAGSTACSAIYGNTVKARCIDNWSEFGGPRDTFIENTTRAGSPNVDFDFVESDFRTVDYGAIGKFNIYLFDGPHAYQDQYDGVIAAQPATEDTYIQIVDDWNWSYVRAGTMDAFAALGAAQMCSIDIRTTQDDTHPIGATREGSAWHNGYFIGLMKKVR